MITVPGEKLKQLQKWIQWTSKASPFYHENFRNNRLIFESYEDFQQLPFTTANDLKERNHAFLTSKKNLWRIFSSTGSTGKSKWCFAGYDLLMNYKDTVRHILRQAHIEVTSDESGAIFLPMTAVAGPLTAEGLQSLEIPVIPFGIYADPVISHPIMKWLRPSFFFVFPSSFLTFTDRLRIIDPEFVNSLRPKAIFCAGELLTKNMREYFESVWNTKCFSLIGSTEVMNHFGVECQQQDGMHLFNEQYFFEILNNETNQVSLEGTGELVITGLINKAMPLIRYRTRDQVRLSYETCSCGWNSPRIWLTERLDDRVVLAGPIKFYVTECISEVVNGFSAVTSVFQLTLSRNNNQDVLDLCIEANNTVVGNSKLETDISNTLVASFPDIREAIHNKVIAMPLVRIVPIGTIERLRGKVRRVIDLRT